MYLIKIENPEEETVKRITTEDYDKACTIYEKEIGKAEAAGETEIITLYDIYPTMKIALQSETTNPTQVIRIEGFKTTIRNRA